MSYRTVYGNSNSENGWPMVDTASCAWVQVPGTTVNLQIQQGQPLQILRAFAADFNAYIEPLRDTDSACWTATNSVGSSNHLSGTALDLNWDSHPFLVANAGFSAAKIATIRELLSFYEGTMFWGNDWDSPKDAMHFQVGYNTYNNPKTASFITRKIRSDGYSTFRRGPVQAQPKTDTPTTGGFMSALSDVEQRALYDEIMGRRNSRSPLRHVGEGAVGDQGDMIFNTDGSVHVMLVQLLARLGDPDSLNLLHEVANMDPSRYPDRTHDKQLAQAILNDIANQATVGSAPPSGGTPGVIPAPVPAPAAVTYQPAPAALPAAPTTDCSLGGGLIGELNGLTQQLRSVSETVTTIVEGTTS